jgi:tRNA-2-methylthio-N6-dimethylallyladenosine synthase
VLVEGQSKKSPQDVTGRTRSNKIVNFEGDLELVGELVWVHVTKAYPHSLRGEIKITSVQNPSIYNLQSTIING